jgi:hypothetical protein
MSDRKVVDVVYGKTHKYEIIKSEGGFLSGSSFYVYRDGKHLASYSSLRNAVERAQKEAVR